MMETIKDKDLLIAQIGYPDEIRPKESNMQSTANNWNFPSPLTCPLQYGYGTFPAGHNLQAHSHLSRKRPTEYKTVEFLYIVEGEMQVVFYTNEKEYLATRTLKTGMFVCMYDGGHGFSVKKPTRMLEVKSGPFTTVEEDKIKWIT